MMIPFERIGSKEHAFVGYVDDIRLGSQKHLLQQWNQTIQ